MKRIRSYLERKAQSFILWILFACHSAITEKVKRKMEINMVGSWLAAGGCYGLIEHCFTVESSTRIDLRQKHGRIISSGSKIYHRNINSIPGGKFCTCLVV